ncbi:MAG: helix-turn-helix domain-containing protein [Cyanobacteria bacterium]|nr:helix-turn-helix domain-containing protein [Cyanobacteria bacterium GSL.Bin21]
MDLLTPSDFIQSMTVQDIAYNVQGFNQIRREINYWQNQELKYIQLPSGIQLKLSNKTVYHDYGKTAEHLDYPLLISHFILSGKQGVISPKIRNVKSEYIERSGEHYLLFLPNIEEIEQYHRGDTYQAIILKIPLCFLENFICELKHIPKALKALLEKESAPRFHQPVGKITPMMETIIQQIWQHPYQGAIAQMYLEAKVLELISLQLFQLLEVYQAQAILQNCYCNPPSMLELAQKTGLDRIKLQQGFRQVFQFTPFQYLQNYRLDLAKCLLEKEVNLTVSNVAHRIGYSNVSYFSRAFKRRFGVTPGQYRSFFSIC